jgi:hypothetical protein
MKKTSSIIDELKFLQKTKEEKDFNSHILIGMDVDKHGIPNSSLLLTQGGTLELIGMIEALTKTLKNLKKTLVRKTLPQQHNRMDDLLKGSSRAEKMIDMLPDNIKEKVLDIKRRMHDALNNDDEEALEKVRKELDELRLFGESFNSDNDNDDEDDLSSFDINDFK